MRTNGQGMTLKQAIKLYNSTRNFENQKPEEVAAWIRFHRIIGQARETALELDIIKIKSPGAVGATQGQRFIINHTQK
jgi:hypothetical protein